MKILTAFKCGAVLATLLSGIGLASTANASEPFIGEVRSFGFNFCPRSWAPADGQLLPINQNQALYSLFGTNYGGDGRTTFALPDLRGRVALHMGTGPGLNPYKVGQKGGAESTVLPQAYASAAADDDSKDGVVTVAGNSGAVNNMPPYTVINWCVALEGIYPSRS